MKEKPATGRRFIFILFLMCLGVYLFASRIGNAIEHPKLETIVVPAVAAVLAVQTFGISLQLILANSARRQTDKLNDEKGQS